MKYTEIRDFSRKLRKNQTHFEHILWKRLQNRQIDGFKFLRQHPILYDRKGNDFNFFIPDFYCAEVRLAIEIDGGIHSSNIEYDSWRQQIMEALEIRVIRFRNEELMKIEVVIEQIRKNLHTHVLPLPTGREGLGRVRD